MTQQEIIERALKTIADPDWEFHECVALLIESELARTNKSGDSPK